MVSLLGLSALLVAVMKATAQAWERTSGDPASIVRTARSRPRVQRVGLLSPTLRNSTAAGEIFSVTAKGHLHKPKSLQQSRMQNQHAHTRKKSVGDWFPWGGADCSDANISGNYVDSGEGDHFTLAQADCTVSFSLEGTGGVVAHSGTVYPRDNETSPVTVTVDTTGAAGDAAGSPWDSLTGEVVTAATSPPSGNINFYITGEDPATRVVQRVWTLEATGVSSATNPPDPTMTSAPMNSGQTFQTTVMPYIVPVVETTVQIANGWTVVPVSTTPAVDASTGATAAPGTPTLQATVPPS